MIRKYLFTSENQLRDLGLLILRLGVGYMFIRHGYPKIKGGMEEWTDLGASMKEVGINFAPAFWGFMAAFAEFGGGILLGLGLFTRLASFMMMVTMIVATAHHFADGDTIMKASHSVELGFLFLAMIFIGAGKYSIDEAIFGRDPEVPNF